MCSTCDVFGCHGVVAQAEPPPPLSMFCLCFVFCPYKDLQVNSKLEVSVKSDQTKRWYDGTVEEIKYEDGKRLLKVRPLPSVPRCAQLTPYHVPGNTQDNIPLWVFFFLAKFSCNQ